MGRHPAAVARILAVVTRADRREQEAIVRRAVRCVRRRHSVPPGVTKMALGVYNADYFHALRAAQLRGQISSWRRFAFVHIVRDVLDVLGARTRREASRA